MRIGESVRIKDGDRVGCRLQTIEMRYRQIVAVQGHKGPVAHVIEKPVNVRRLAEVLATVIVNLSHSNYDKAMHPIGLPVVVALLSVRVGSRVELGISDRD